MKTILLASALTLLATTATSAQCTYRMNDVGRPHGFVSGPCNGASKNLAGAYPSRQQPATNPGRHLGQRYVVPSTPGHAARGERAERPKR
jgi:hypothetical protein